MIMKNSRLNFHHLTIGRIGIYQILGSNPLPHQAKYPMWIISLNPYINYFCIKSVNGKWEILDFIDSLTIMPLANVSQFQITPPLGQVFYVNYFNQSIHLPHFVKSLTGRWERLDYRFFNNYTPSICHLISNPTAYK